MEQYIGDHLFRLFPTTGLAHHSRDPDVLHARPERVLGCARLAVLYFGAGINGYLASAVFVPHRAEAGPSGALFGVLSAFVELMFVDKHLDCAFKLLLPSIRSKYVVVFKAPFSADLGQVV
jgi:membrane associated rhomboid family serine protease